MILFLTACQQIDDDKKVINYSNYLKYSNSGFTLVYDEKLKKDNKISKKIDDNALVIFHKKIKKNSFVKITNPVNNIFFSFNINLNIQKFLLELLPHRLF